MQRHARSSVITLRAWWGSSMRPPGGFRASLQVHRWMTDDQWSLWMASLQWQMTPFYTPDKIQEKNRYSPLWRGRPCRQTGHTLIFFLWKDMNGAEKTAEEGGHLQRLYQLVKKARSFQSAAVGTNAEKTPDRYRLEVADVVNPLVELSVFSSASLCFCRKRRPQQKTFTQTETQKQFAFSRNVLKHTDLFTPLVGRVRSSHYRDKWLM